MRMDAIEELLTVLILWRNELSRMVWRGSRGEHQMPYLYFCQQTSFTCINVVLVKAALMGVNEGGCTASTVFAKYLMIYVRIHNNMLNALTKHQANGRGEVWQVAGQLPLYSILYSYTISYTAKWLSSHRNNPWHGMANFKTGKGIPLHGIRVPSENGIHPGYEPSQLPRGRHRDTCSTRRASIK